ncbi:MAG TPA: efflux RND transporter periplasmic adaptor subunit [Candidatus Aminicenantes bacterium]|nr:efflux RND transporter periplasmic adaptor subunit [Candidatus Aminicenantes bacterium]HRY63758.1 efflux RND transporter periplasmic adaptor subunit [Candidatus Aminicenantes bacterium]HRZ70671.1 efflux RND transporter periplasmic adaptor subunit [Candidatus Aminicenantes bacterium]
MNARNACSIAFAALALLPACRSSNDAASGPVPVRVAVRTVAPAAAGREFAYSGTIVESESLPQSFAVSGTVTAVHVDEGDAVAKGALLAELDGSTSRQALEMAQAVEKQAEDAFARLSRMYKNGNLPEIKYVEVETGLQKAKAAAAIAGKNVADCRLYATAAGYVGKRSIEPGMIALPNMASITIVRIDKVFARVPVPENDIALIRKGDPAVVRIGALEGREYEGRVEDIGVVADVLAHSYKVRIAVANPDRALKPGMVCTAGLSRAARVSGVVVPNEAVLVDETGRRYVYVLDAAGARAAVRAVKLGELLQSGVRVVEGLAAGETIVVSGQHKLVDGAAVQVVER